MWLVHECLCTSAFTEGVTDVGGCGPGHICVHTAVKSVTSYVLSAFRIRAIDRHNPVIFKAAFFGNVAMQQAYIINLKYSYEMGRY